MSRSVNVAPGRCACRRLIKIMMVADLGCVRWNFEPQASSTGCAMFVDAMCVEIHRDPAR
jgi:hypothetical protein